MIKKRWGEKVNLSVYLYWFTDVDKWSGQDVSGM